MKISVERFGSRLTLSHLNPDHEVGNNLPLVEDFYFDHCDEERMIEEGLIDADGKSLVTVRLRADFTRDSRVSPTDRTIYLDIQAAHDVIALSRFLREWQVGERVFCYVLIGIYAEILAANSRISGARALVSVRKRRARRGFFSDCRVQTKRYPETLNYKVVDEQYSDTVKAFLYFHELFHLLKFRERSQTNFYQPIDLDDEERECDIYAMQMIEELREYYDFYWFMKNCPAVIFSSVLINNFASHWSKFGDLEARSRLLSSTAERAVKAVAKPLEIYAINSRPMPSLAQPYIDQVQEELAQARASFETILHDLEDLFDEAARYPDFEKTTLAADQNQFWMWIAEIKKSGDDDLEAAIGEDDWLRMYSDTKGLGRTVAIMFAEGEGEDDTR